MDSEPVSPASRLLLHPYSIRVILIACSVALFVAGIVVVIMEMTPESMGSLEPLIMPSTALYVLGFLSAAFALAVVSKRYEMIFQVRLQEQVRSISRLLQEKQRQDVSLMNLSGELNASQRALNQMMDSLNERERVLSHKTEELERTMQFKSQFIGRMSHELRTPLTSVIGFSDLMLKQNSEGLGETHLRHLHIINTNGMYLLRLIESLMDISNIELGRSTMLYQRASLKALIEEVASTMSHRLGARDQKLHTHLENALPEIELDVTRVKKILINFIINASKYSHQGGEIRLSAWRKGHDILFSVADAGRGFSPAEQERISRELEGPEINYKEGNNLGLALAKRYVELHGGRMWFKSALGVGSEFCFSLPAIQSKSRPISESVRAPADAVSESQPANGLPPSQKSLPDS